jgi:hypothetical protein
VTQIVVGEMEDLWASDEFKVKFGSGRQHVANKALAKKSSTGSRSLCSTGLRFFKIMNLFKYPHALGPSESRILKVTLVERTSRLQLKVPYILHITVLSTWKLQRDQTDTKATNLNKPRSAGQR